MNNSARLRSFWPLLLWAVSIVIAVTIFSFVSPESLITYIGVESSYALLFVLALLGGFSMFSGVPYYIVLVTLAASGLNPFFIGATAAVAVMLGDSTSYLIGYLGRAVVPHNITTMLDRLTRIREQRPWAIPIVCFLYGVGAPFSNDLITIPTGLMHYPFWKVFVPLALGNIIFNVTLALLSVHAYSLVQAVFL